MAPPPKARKPLIMSRSAAVLVVLVVVPLFALGRDPDPVEKALALQKALESAEKFLAANMPGEAVSVLEAELSNADGNRAYLALLRRAYAAEIRVLEANPAANADRLAQMRRKLNLLGGPAPGALAPPSALAPPNAAAPAEDLLGAARALFKQGQYAAAGDKFAAARNQAALGESDTAAWVYCRLKLAAERVNAANCDAATAAAAEKDVLAAMQLVPGNAELQHVGRKLLVVARQRQANPAAATPTAPGADRPVGEAFATLETPSFRVRYQGDRTLAERLASTAETQRQAIFERWSGPPAGPWDQPKCELVLHPSAECFARMTQRPAAATGHAIVKLNGGRARERRIDVRADDPLLLTNALPRELTHVILADLFPSTPPPKWAQEGMAVLAGDPDEVSRFIRTLPRCYREGQLFPVGTLMELKEFPEANRITGFYCESVALVDYLVKLKGERTFTVFLRDCQRYGISSALKRTYGLDSPQALELAWKPIALDTARGQQP